MSGCRNATPGADSAARWRSSERGFAEAVHRHRHELRLHCYRMLGSFDEAEDLVQETLLRAWWARAAYEGHASVRVWLHRIATNACIDRLKRRPRPPLPPDGHPLLEVSWLQPCPDTFLDRIAPPNAEPPAAAVPRRTVELAFLAAIQHLAPHQRAALILRDVLAWPADATAEALEAPVAAVDSALHRARAALREFLPPERSDWSRADRVTPLERQLLERYMAAHERADMAALAAIVSWDIRMSMPPGPRWFIGRTELAAVLTPVFVPGSPGYLGRLHMLPTTANRQPAAACYLRRPGEAAPRAIGLDVLRIEDGYITDITCFPARTLAEFELPMTI
jgi:RNA polymerase sigma-70 factor, ECF subfamily